MRLEIRFWWRIIYLYNAEKDFWQGTFLAEKKRLLLRKTKLLMEKGDEGGEEIKGIEGWCG